MAIFICKLSTVNHRRLCREKSESHKHFEITSANIHRVEWTSILDTTAYIVSQK